MRRWNMYRWKDKEMATMTCSPGGDEMAMATTAKPIMKPSLVPLEWRRLRGAGCRSVCRTCGPVAASALGGTRLRIGDRVQVQGGWAQSLWQRLGTSTSSLGVGYCHRSIPHTVTVLYISPYLGAWYAQGSRQAWHIMRRYIHISTPLPLKPFHNHQALPSLDDQDVF